MHLLFLTLQVVAEKTFAKNPHGVAEAVLQKNRAIENGSIFSDTESVRSGTSTTSGDSDSSSIDSVVFQESSSCSEFGTDNGAIIRAGILGEILSFCL